MRNEDLLFGKFKESWNTIMVNGIDIDKLATFDYVNSPKIVVENAKKSLAFLQTHLDKNTFQREDYRELCQLAVVYLGGTVQNFSFQLPGAIHHARFMAKCLYYLKMLLVSTQTDIFHQKEIKEIQIMGEFVGVFYSVFWFKSPMAVSAPALDLGLVATMREYRKINPEISDACLQSLSRHEWYLTEELCPLSLADTDLSDSVRKCIADEMVCVGRQEGEFIIGKPKFPEVQTEEFWRDVDPEDVLMGLGKLVGVRSWSLFNMLGLSSSDTQWLNEEVVEWEKDSGYNEFSHIVKGLSVVNDTAERGVKLIQDFVDSTPDETYRQDIMMAVSDHRKEISTKNLTKKQLSD